MVVKANYSDGTNTAVTGYTVSPANNSILSSAGTKTVTVTYQGKTATFSIIVNKILTPQKFTVDIKTRFWDGLKTSKEEHIYKNTQWDDAFFDKNSDFYNHDLAKLCAILSNAVYCNKSDRDSNPGKYIDAAFKALKFNNDNDNDAFHNSNSSLHGSVYSMTAKGVFQEHA